ncbi:unnamed protein product [Gordionus sp. m RMFG-2023]|uniref:insulin-like growth factor-binding protein-related protein 1 n=1 Tax=Gordionus sp. m RMFG-2023 TaxID=3053472 RepID=UPI0030DE80CB
MLRYPNSLLCLVCLAFGVALSQDSSYDFDPNPNVEYPPLPPDFLSSFSSSNQRNQESHPKELVGDEDVCGHCFFDRCPRPEKCEAGITRDHCGCCFVCAQKEGQMCEGPSHPYPDHHNILGRKKHLGTCGEDLDCVLREDVVPDFANPLLREGRAVLGEPQYLCKCRHTETLCGSNEKTYDNLCKLMEDAYRDHEKIKVSFRGPCQSAPWIHTGPENVYNETGSQVALICEVKGYPIPVVEWNFHGSNGLIVSLPSDDNHVAVLARGGPEKYQVTSWLQIQGLVESDDGEYTCFGINKYGQANSTARLQVFQRGDPRYKRFAEL